MRGISCRLRLVAFLALTLTCYGYQVSVQNTPQLQNPAPRRTVTGMVTNAVSGEPIRRALVQLSGSRSASVLTGPDGRFSIEDVPEGWANLWVTKPGFFDCHSLPGGGGRQCSQAYTIGSGKNDFALMLFPAAKILGRLIDQDGEGIEQTQVQVLTEQIFNGHKQVVSQNNSFTDDDGSFRFDDLLPGQYIVYAAGHSFPGSSWDAPPEVSAPAYYPNAAELASAQPVGLQPGQEFRADLRLRAQRGFRISGSVGGYPAGLGLSFSLENLTGQPVLSQGINVDPARGRFVVQAVPSGTWTLVLSATNTQGHSYEARQEIAVNGADLPNLQILLHPSASIPVIVNHATSAGEGPPEQPPGNPGLNAILFSADPSNPLQYGMTAHGEPATLSFDNVPQGKYRLSVQSFGSECVEAEWYGNVDLLRNHLIVGSEGETPPLTINLSKACATLSAKIASGEDQTSASLVVVRSSSLSEPNLLSFAMQTPLSGPFYGSLTLSPGSYQVYAFTSLEGLEYANPEALRDYPSQRIDLTPGQKAELTVKVSERKAN